MRHLHDMFMNSVGYRGGHMMLLIRNLNGSNVANSGVFSRKSWNPPPKKVDSVDTS